MVYADADLDKAIAGSANAIFFNQGECCVAGSRLYVEESVYDQVVEGVAEQARTIKVGNGLDPATNMGPLVSEEQFDRVTGYIESGRADGAGIIGGDRVGDRGYFVAPTVLTGTREDMKVVQEEIFGPVVAAAPFSRERDILPTANNTNYGLGAGVFTRDVSKAYRTAGDCAPAPCGSTPGTSSTPPCPSAATRSRAGAGRWATRSSTTTWRPRPSSPI